MNITVKYLLSGDGQKASILAGGNGQREQSIGVGRDDPEFTRSLAAASVNSDGTAVLDLTYGQDQSEPRRREWDVVPTITEILDDLTARKATYAAEKDAEQAKVRAEAMEVVANRKTTTGTRSDYSTKPATYYQAISPDWPYGTPADVKESPEAIAWMADMDAENERRRVAAIEQAGAEQEAKEAARLAAEQARIERRARLGLEDGETAWPIEDGALTKVPCYETHARGKNWMAVIAANPSAPGGLEREFAAKAKGSSYYIVPSLDPGDAVEFGGDYFSGSGRRSTSRWYGYVVRIRPGDEYESRDMLVMYECDTGKQAIKAGEKFRKVMAKATV